MGVLGCDVSNHQGIVNWPRLAADGIRYAWCKSTEGQSFLDKQFARNMVEARKAGIAVGAYHYARPDNNSPRQEAEFFLRVLGTPRDGDLLPVLDFEAPEARSLGATALNAWAVEWLELVAAEIGAAPVFYSFPSYIAHAMRGGTRALRGYPLWLADYGPNDGKKHRLGAVSRSFVNSYELVAHQYTSNGRYGGYARLDMNDAASLERLRYRVEPVKPGRRPLPGPGKKPAWFWLALKEYLRRRREGT